MITVQEENFRGYHRELGAMKGRFTMAIGVSTMAIMYFSNSYFYGKMIGTLPFEPWSIVSNMSHRGLHGTEMNEVSMIFVYIVS